LKKASLCLECDDVSRPMHTGSIGLDGPPDQVVSIEEINNDNFSLLTNADVSVGFEGLKRNYGQYINSIFSRIGVDETYTVGKTYGFWLRLGVSNFWGVTEKHIASRRIT
jgi:hypothetical protein